MRRSRTANEGAPVLQRVFNIAECSEDAKTRPCGPSPSKNGEAARRSRDGGSQEHGRAEVSVTASAEVPCGLKYVFTAPVWVSVTVTMSWTLVVAAKNTQ